MSERGTITFSGRVWVWQARSGERSMRWFFVSIEGEAAAEIKLASLGLTAGFGSLPVRVRIGATAWRTSVFPQRETGGWLLPLKADVRKREGLEEGSEVEVAIDI
ncbi:DUF1905 domain-containing protein [Novosphingobium sp. KACC 22771]|uniref:DUF1905 domain-containing protein n=1 Tax=Novosphingobium sp. KACC 22771 TaxID=3025670 RepID=UPI00236678C9|nr:DUF1905 domain-containing protein [Novosphingobium sp. KACC 22771]WDF71336.1 DUF1905 domain-containing protein [Novosphingobium sp. KACC 22771]